MDHRLSSFCFSSLPPLLSPPLFLSFLLTVFNVCAFMLVLSFCLPFLFPSHLFNFLFLKFDRGLVLNRCSDLTPTLAIKSRVGTWEHGPPVGGRGYMLFA